MRVSAAAPAQPSDPETRVVRIAAWEAGAWALMVTVGESVAFVYLSKAGVDGAILGLLATAPAALGALVQASLPKLFSRASCVHQALACVLIQVLGLATIAFGIRATGPQLPTIGAGLCLYWIGGMGSAAPWQEWMSRIVSRRAHNGFFAKRATVASIVTLASFIPVGLLLQERLDATVMHWLLFGAALMRLGSFSLLCTQPRPAAPNAATSPTLALAPSYSRTPRAAPGGPGISLAALCALHFLFKGAVYFSSPFYIPYMLNEMRLTPLSYFYLTAVPLLARIAVLRNWGRLLDEKRLFEGLLVSLMVASCLPSLWPVSTNLGYLSILQLGSGFAWSGFDLIVVIMVQTLYPHRILQALSLFLAAGSLGNVLGGVAGGSFLDKTGNYAYLFHISGALRLVTGFAMLHYMRRCGAFRFRSLALRAGVVTILSMRPSIELISRVFPWNPDILRKRHAPAPAAGHAHMERHAHDPRLASRIASPGDDSSRAS